MRFVVAAALVFALSSCQYMPFDRDAGQEPLTPEQRLLIVCEGWTSIFTRINARDKFDLASHSEVEAINNTIPILNPICTGNPGAEFNILDLEAALFAVITAETDK